MTVKELKKILEDLPDDYTIKICTGSNETLLPNHRYDIDIHFVDEGHRTLGLHSQLIVKKKLR